MSPLIVQSAPQWLLGPALAFLLVDQAREELLNNGEHHQIDPAIFSPSMRLHSTTAAIAGAIVPAYFVRQSSATAATVNSANAQCISAPQDACASLVSLCLDQVTNGEVRLALYVTGTTHISLGSTDFPGQSLVVTALFHGRYLCWGAFLSMRSCRVTYINDV